MKNKATILIMFGVSGSLSRKYLLPALCEIASLCLLPQDFHLVGLTRKNGVDIGNLLGEIAGKDILIEKSSVYKIDVNNKEDYENLAEYLDDLAEKFSSESSFVFYLAVPPEVTQDIIISLGESRLAKKDKTKIILEKPFGFDLESAKVLQKHIEKYFSTESVQLVDHYLAKDVARKILPFREENNDFKKYWNKDFVAKIEIIASENIDIENRVDFYEQTGAIRDFLQNHLLELLATVLSSLSDIKDESFARLEVLKYLKIKNIKLGQYSGYTKEVKNPKSKTETFVQAELWSDDERWQGVPIYLMTGKAMQERFAEARVSFEKNCPLGEGTLVFNLQPEGKIKWQDREVSLQNLGQLVPLSTYGLVLYSVMLGDTNVFVSIDESMQSWEILKNAESLIARARENLIIYDKGSNIYEIL